MAKSLPSFKKVCLILTSAFIFTACKKNDDDTPSLRTPILYSKVTDTTTYSSSNGLFVDASGKSTVDFSTAAYGYKAFKALNDYCTLSKTQSISATTLANMYTNANNAFADASINASGVKLSELTASSWTATAAQTVRAKFNTDFTAIATTSGARGVTASSGVAGKLGSYLVDSKGIETQQVIQKGLIGAYQLDLISNVLLNTGLNADNNTPVSGKNYTALEHNWDLAFATLTPNGNYLRGSTATTKGTVEFALGSYVWEYNQENYSKILPAFIKGRIAIVNNDQAEVNAQALYIRQQLEKVIIKASLGYLGKWRTGTDDASRAHAIAEGLGFIYSLRFCNLSGGDAAFSDSVLNNLINSPNGFWDLDINKIVAAETAIKAKFGL